MSDLSNFGLAGALIGVFFIPATWKLYKRNQEIQDARVDDLKGIISEVVGLMREVRDAAKVTGDKSDAIYTFIEKMEAKINERQR